MQNNHEGTFYDGNVLYLQRVVDYTSLCTVKINKSVHTRYVYFTECKFYLKKIPQENIELSWVGLLFAVAQDTDFKAPIVCVLSLNK